MSEGGAAGLSQEDRLIARHFAPLAGHPGALGLQDDCALYTPPAGWDLVLKADAIIGTVHFFPEDPPDLVARKALRVNLSDLAAKGADAAGFLLSLALPRSTSEDWIEAFAGGLKADAEEFSFPLLGGDTVASPGPIMVSVAAFGIVPAGRMVRRGGARQGDVIMVTGTIGDAALGLRLRRGDALSSDIADAAREHVIDRYLLPQPRNALAGALRAHAHGAMDVSDGLVGDLTKMCRASGVSAIIDAANIPLSSAARALQHGQPALIAAMLTGGDDYEVLFTLPDERVSVMRERAAKAGIAVTAIGRVIEGTAPPRFVGENGETLEFVQSSFSHF